MSLRIFIIFVCSFELAFAMTIETLSVVKRSPASGLDKASYDVLIAEIKSFEKAIYGYDKVPVCETVEALDVPSIELEETENLQSVTEADYDQIRDLFLERNSYIVTNSSSGAMTREEIEDLLKTALDKGFSRNQLEDIIFDFEDGEDFKVYFEETIANIEAENKRNENRISRGENTQENYFIRLDKMKKNACGDYIYTVEKENVGKGQKQECYVPRVEGQIEKFSKAIQELESNKQELEEMPDHQFKMLKAASNRAHRIRKKLELYLNSRNFTEELIQKLVIQYISKVVIGMRDFVVISKAYSTTENRLEGLYESLLIDIPAHLFSYEADKFIWAIQSGSKHKFKKHWLLLDPVKAESRVGERVLSYRPRFNKVEVHKRDMITLMNAPTKKNYIQTLKWYTLVMLGTQMQTYNALIGKDGEPVEIPRSCRENFNSNLPEFFNLPYEKGKGEEILNSVLDDLMFLPEFTKNEKEKVDERRVQSVIKQFIENTSGNPFKDGYSGVSSVEKYLWADYAIKGRSFEKYGEPNFDDYEDFDMIVHLKTGQFEKAFTHKNRARVQKYKKTMIYKDLDVFKAILNPVDSKKVFEVFPHHLDEELDGAISYNYGAKEKVSEYLAKVMQREGYTDVKEFIEDKLPNSFNSRVYIPFPSLYGNPIWRHWALKEMAEFVERNLVTTNGSKLYAETQKACVRTTVETVMSQTMMGSSLKTIKKYTKICGDQNKNVFEELHKSLRSFLDTSQKHVSTKELLARNISKDWDILRALWNAWSKNGQVNFKAGSTTEKDFIVKHLKLGNRWAMARLGYVHLLNEINVLGKSFTPETTRTPKRRNGGGHLTFTGNTFCFMRNVLARKTNLVKAGEVLGIDKPITLFHGNSLLKKKEKKSIWSMQMGELTDLEHNMGLMSKKIKGAPAFKLLDEISYKNFFTKERALSFAKEKLEYYDQNDDKQSGLSPLATQELQSYRETNDAKITDFYVEILGLSKEEAPDNLNEVFSDHVNLLEQFVTVYGDPEQYDSKQALLVRDHKLKRILAKDMIRRLAKDKLEEVRKGLEGFCSLDSSDHEAAKAQFFWASKNHAKLNRILGVSDEVMAKIEKSITKMSAEEFRDIFIGLGLAAASMGAILIGATASVLGAGAGIGMVIAGVTALKLQYDLLEREVGRKLSADQYEAIVKEAEELGLADLNSSDKVSRTWIWTVVEAIGFIPMINIVAKSANGGIRIAKASVLGFANARANGHGVWSSWKASGRASKTAYKNVDVDVSKVIIGLDDLDDAVDIGKDIAKSNKGSKLAEEVTEELTKLDTLKNQGKISMRELMKRVGGELEKLQSFAQKSYEASDTLAKSITKIDVKTLNTKTAQKAAGYWGNKVEPFLNYFSSYWGKTGTVHSRLRGDRIKYARWAYARAKEGKFLWGTNWWYKFRYGHLGKYGSKMVKIRRELEQLKNAKSIEIDGVTIKTLEDYMFHRMDDLTTIFSKIPIRKRELPYMFLIMGGPDITTLKLLNVPIPKFMKGPKSLKYSGGFLANGIAMKNIFMSRAVILSSIHERIVRSLLKMPENMANRTIGYEFSRVGQVIDASIDLLLRDFQRDYGDDLSKIIKGTVDERKSDEIALVVSKSKNSNELKEGLIELKLSRTNRNKIMTLTSDLMDTRNSLYSQKTAIQTAMAEETKEMLKKYSVRHDIGNVVVAFKDFYHRTDQKRWGHLLKVFPSLFMGIKGQTFSRYKVKDIAEIIPGDHIKTIFGKNATPEKVKKMPRKMIVEKIMSSNSEVLKDVNVNTSFNLLI
ncbi:MAG: hypothetical protein ACPGJV_06320 [Bacteriovoracaceae bacterium]